jgi:two-component system response regulator PilR (NtrC family)
VKGFDPETRTALLTYAWPGNVRELENVMERAVTLTNTEIMDLSVLPVNLVQSLQKFKAGTALKLETKGELLKPSSTPLDISQSAHASKDLLQLPAPDFAKGPINLDQILSDIEKTYVLKALEHSGGVKKKAAQLLGVTFRSIRYRLEKLGIESALEEND